MKDFLETIIKYIVEEHDLINVEEVEGDGISVLKPDNKKIDFIRKIAPLRTKKARKICSEEY